LDVIPRPCPRQRGMFRMRCDNAMMDHEKVLERADDDGVATLTLNRPRQYNALSRALLEALHGQIDALAGDEAIRVVVITGAGNAFCAGHDLKEMRAGAAQREIESLFTSCSAMMQKLIELPQP